MDAGRRKKRLRLITSLGGPLAVIGVLVYILVSHGHDIERAAKRAPLITLVGVTLLALITLLVRTEEAVVCMTAMDRRPSRLHIHAASSVAFLVSTLNHYLAGIIRAAILQRLDRRRAPTIPQMIVVDSSTYLIEGCLAAILLVVSASVLKLEWWIAPLVVAGAAAAFALALAIRKRFARHPLFLGLAMLAHSRYRLVVVALTVVVFACQISRTLIVLHAVGLHATLLQAVATFIAAGVLSNLLAGPAAGTAGAPLIIFGAQSLGAAAAAGLILSISAVLAAAVYSLTSGPVILVHRRRERGLELRTAGPIEVG